jgi:hypothetical protein
MHLETTEEAPAAKNSKKEVEEKLDLEKSDDDLF